LGGEASTISFHKQTSWVTEGFGTADLKDAEAYSTNWASSRVCCGSVKLLTAHLAFRPFLLSEEADFEAKKSIQKPKSKIVGSKWALRRA
jgi:hypothetical protein